MATVFSKLTKKLTHAWNAFKDENQNLRIGSYGEGMTYGNRQDRSRLRLTNERSIVASIYTRLSIDVAAINIRHVRLDDDDRYLEDIPSGLNDCLKVQPNKDQGPRSFIQDIALTLFDKGVAAIVPVDTNVNPFGSAGIDIQSMRVGEIVAWMPDHVRVSLYNDARGLRQEITLEKRFVAIVQNPLAPVMNETNSTLQRLIRKLNLLDAVDEQSSSGKLDLIIQLPYVVKSEARRQQADQRRKDIEHQLKGSQYGIAYTDGTEKITQLNRPAENNLLKQVEYLTGMLYNQLGLTVEVMNGTADEAAMLNYHNRTTEPIVGAIVEAMLRAFLTKTARSQKQWILGFRDAFKYVPLKDFADIADKLSRNKVVTSNELRQAVGIKPSKDPEADKLQNANMPEPTPSVDNPEPIRVGSAQVTRRQISSAPSESASSLNKN